jgi:hypothetical protein
LLSSEELELKVFLDFCDFVFFWTANLIASLIFS